MSEEYIPKTKMRKYRLLAIALATLLLAILVFFSAVDTASKNGGFVNDGGIYNSVEDSGGPVFSVSVKLNSKDGEKEYIDNNVSGQDTVFDVLKDISEENGIELKYNNNYKYGVFVESIGGVENGKEGKYWQYYVDSILGDVAADKKILKEGDSVEWRFERVEF